MLLHRQQMETLLERYGIHPPVSDKRFLRHGAVARGTRLNISFSDQVTAKQLTVACADAEVSHSCPLTLDNADTVVKYFQDKHLVPDRAQEHSTLAHLLMRASALYVGERLQRLTLDPVYLRANDYRIGAVVMAHRGAIDIKARLETDAHDRGAVFAYRPTSRLKNAKKDTNKA